MLARLDEADEAEAQFDAEAVDAEQCWFSSGFGSLAAAAAAFSFSARATAASAAPE